MKVQNNKLKIVVLSGEICSGKSDIAIGLQNKYDAKIIKTRDLILSILPKTKNERSPLQRAGDKLDRDTKCGWIADALAKKLSQQQLSQIPSGLYIVDSIRKKGQLDALRKAYGAVVHHIHVSASPEELKKRFVERASDHDASANYEKIKRTATERGVVKLSVQADVLVSTDKCTAEAALVRATALLNLYPRSNDRLDRKSVV